MSPTSVSVSMRTGWRRSSAKLAGCLQRKLLLRAARRQCVLALVRTFLCGSFLEQGAGQRLLRALPAAAQVREGHPHPFDPKREDEQLYLRSCGGSRPTARRVRLPPSDRARLERAARRTHAATATSRGVLSDLRPDRDGPWSRTTSRSSCACASNGRMRAQRACRPTRSGAPSSSS